MLTLRFIALVLIFAQQYRYYKGPIEWNISPENFFWWDVKFVFRQKCVCIELNSENESKSWKSFERMNTKQCQLFFSNDNLNLTLAIKIAEPLSWRASSILTLNALLCPTDSKWSQSNIAIFTFFSAFACDNITYRFLYYTVQ